MSTQSTFLSKIGGRNNLGLVKTQVSAQRRRRCQLGGGRPKKPARASLRCLAERTPARTPEPLQNAFGVKGPLDAIAKFWKVSHLAGNYFLTRIMQFLRMVVPCETTTVFAFFCPINIFSVDACDFFSNRNKKSISRKEGGGRRLACRYFG